MAKKAVKAFLIKIIPVFVLTLLVWQPLGASRYYHWLIVQIVNLLYPLIDSIKLVTTVASVGNEFVVEFSLYGQQTSVILNALVITSNMAMLLTLFLASPIRPYTKLFLKSLYGSLAVLIVIHVLSLFASIQNAFLTHPQIASSDVFGSVESTFINVYTQFYEIIGMFLFVLALWFFYITTYVSRSTSAAKTAIALQGIKKKAP